MKKPYGQQTACKSCHFSRLLAELRITTNPVIKEVKCKKEKSYSTVVYTYADLREYKMNSQWNGKISISQQSWYDLNALTLGEAHCWWWVRLLTGCHGYLARHKDHLCLRLVQACLATQAALICCIKAPEIPELVKYYFSPPTLPSH